LIACILCSAFAKTRAHYRPTILLFPRKKSCIPLRPRRIRELPILQATRARIGKHALRIAHASPDRRPLRFNSGDDSRPGCGHQQHLVRLSESKVEAYLMTSQSPNIVPRGTGGEPTWREPTRKSTLSTWTSCMNRTGFV
jgi:hypothetical protein